MFSAFKPCPSLVKLPDCSSLLPSQSCRYLSVYHCLLRSRPNFAFGYSLSPSDFVPLLIGLFFWFDLPACHWTCCSPGTFSKTSFLPHCGSLRLGHCLHVTLLEERNMVCLNGGRGTRINVHKGNTSFNFRFNFSI